MSDMISTIVPRSDQLNSDDLIGRTITIKVTAVTIGAGGGTDQPVSIYYENDNNKPFKPCKSMRRVLVQIWGNDSKQYVGKSMTLYRDEGVIFAGVKVGGIRISHMSHLQKEVTIALTASKAKRSPYTVKPLPGDWTEPAKAKEQTPPKDWVKELYSANTLDELGKVWTSIPPAEKQNYLKEKDIRKGEITEEMNAKAEQQSSNP